jgi:hypothetical protein
MGWAGHIIRIQGIKETILGLQEVGIDYYIIYMVLKPTLFYFTDLYVDR